MATTTTTTKTATYCPFQLHEFKAAPENAFMSLESGDWRDDLKRDGFAVIKQAIPPKRALDYQTRARAWLKTFGNDALDYEDPETWIDANLPVHTPINTYGGYKIAHEKFMWDARMEPGVLQVFNSIWGTEELLVSFDSLNITFPNRKDVERLKAWEHIDQSPLRRGLQCVQGIISLSTAGPDDGGLVVYPGSHLLNDEWLDSQPDKSRWTAKDLYLLNEEEIAWFKSKGLGPHKVCADIGDLIV